jgi:glycosyltransferase involved in cell wall biosynthesis
MMRLPFGIEPELFVVSEDRLSALRSQFSIASGQAVVLSPRGAKPVYQADIILAGFEQLLLAGDSKTRFLFLSAGYLVADEVRQKAEFLEKSYPNFSFVADALPRETMYALWNLVDVFVSAPVYDGYSAALAEGRFAGAIPVVNDIPGNRELISHLQNGWVCAPFTPIQLATDLKMILADLTSFKTRFASRNRQWILENSLIRNNVERFLLELSRRFH